ncbi:hypothetical protein IKQ26_01640 [bacterium]|nr:hypothetical protein [bacterium]
MNENFKGLDSLDTTVRKSAVIQERMGLIASHMYQQFLDYKHSSANMLEVFDKMADNAYMTIDYFKQALSSRGMPIQNISIEYDKSLHYIGLNILWHKLGFVTSYNEKPKALFREGDDKNRHIISRITAFRGNLADIASPDSEEYIQKLLALEVASLYIPEDKTVSAIIKINHIGDKEFKINQMDAPREFLLRAVEIVCGSWDYHEESFRKTIQLP